MNAASAPAAESRAPLRHQAAELADRVRNSGLNWAEWYACSDKVADQAANQWAEWTPDAPGTKAAWTFTGEAFGRLLPATWSHPDRAEQRLRVLSGLYGILRPSDGVMPYRLDVGQSLNTDWLVADSEGAPVINCASDEYAEVLDRARFTWIDCVFLQTVNGKPRSVSALSKQARGAMGRFLANHASDDPEVAKKFKSEGYAFQRAASNETRWVCVRT